MLGNQLDSIVRQHLWAGGFDYPGVETGHSISHGIGKVEGGACMSDISSGNSFSLREGMIISIGTNPRLASSGSADKEDRVYISHLYSVFDLKIFIW